MVMTPPQLHIKVLDLFRAVLFLIETVIAPGAQGAVVTGMQGIGVSTPSAAEVAAATCGFETVVHIAKDGILTIGLLSMIVAAGILDVVTMSSGSTLSVDGAVPKEHFIEAPEQTNCPIILSSSRFFVSAYECVR